MKKIIFILILAVTFVFITAFSVSAADIDSLPDQNDKYPAQIDELLPDDFRGNTAAEIANGMSVGKIINVVLSTLKALLPKTLKSISAVLGLVIISSVVGVVRENTAREELKDILSYISAICVCGAAYSVIGNIFAVVREYVSVVGIILKIIIPSVSILAAASGSVTFSVASGGVMYSALAVLQSLCEGFVLPLIRICLCISFGATALGNDALAGVSASVKKFASVVLSFIMLVFSFVLGIRGVVAASADSAAQKSIKFAASSMIPIVGGAVGDAVGSVSGSVSVVRSVVGVAGAAILLLVTIGPLCALGIYKLAFEFISMAAGMLGLNREAKFLSDVSGAGGFLMAVVSCICVFFIISLGLAASVGG
ncbi:MAG: hypothetical protein IJR55_04320 [Clostridia bacterium]|nr:hypothetical protein [Clostridia bacterium]